MKRSVPPRLPDGPGYLMYEEAARYDRVQIIVFVLIIAATLVPAVVLLFFDIAGAATMFGVTVLDILIFHLAFPRRYQIYNTKLKIVLGWPLSWEIRLTTIKEARPAAGSTTWVYGGVRLATSSATAIEIVRRKGMGVIISPSNRETFLEQLNAAVKLAQRRI
ncbi:MAG: PH domain-containing protein [Dehalococcoidia bacterium]|nr:PH domain-containing protein [Dehalococcoidia bacterium]